ncbi:MAG: ATP-binding protein [Planctomycetota bacterium]
MARKSGGRVRLKPYDPFELIRLLARTQSDPRKAVAELVQNSLDAEARRVEVAWFNEKGRRALRVWDDGEGVFPDLDREAALRKIAQTIGHSHKLKLSPAQRRQHMVLGKYGIGLLGFWSVGEEMVIRSRVGGGDARCLRLLEDRPEGEIFRPRARLDDPGTFTEITVRRVHQGVVRQVRPPRLQAYLARELRGQLLGRETEVRIRDRVARGRAPKEFLVRGQPYQGRPLEELATLEVPGHDEARLELYLVSPDEERHGRVALTCGGSTVLEDIAAVEGTDAPRAPWDSGRIEGVIDFPDLQVAPGTRRGFVPDAASDALLRALGGVEEELDERLAEEDRRREEERRQNLAREIRRAFRSVARRLPEYEMFDVRAGQSAAGGAEPEGAGVGGPAPSTPAAPGTGTEPAEGAGTELFPPGPLAAVRISPARVRVPPAAVRALRARPLDADDRPAAGDVGYRWRLLGAGELHGEGARAAYTAPAFDARAEVRVEAFQDGVTAEARAEVTVLEELESRDKVAGIPEPRPVNAPGERWRSRMRGDAWEYNVGHRDYQAVSDVEARRLRYVFHLFAKELVLRNFGRPADAELLERLVEVLTYLDARR